MELRIENDCQSLEGRANWERILKVTHFYIYKINKIWRSKFELHDLITRSNHEFEQSLGVGDGQGSLACCNSWGRKESDTTEPLIWSDLIWFSISVSPQHFCCPEDLKSYKSANGHKVQGESKWMALFSQRYYPYLCMGLPILPCMYVWILHNPI